MVREVGEVGPSGDPIPPADRPATEPRTDPLTAYGHLEEIIRLAERAINDLHESEAEAEAAQGAAPRAEGLPHHPNFPGKQHVLPKPTQPRPKPAPPPPQGAAPRAEGPPTAYELGVPEVVSNGGTLCADCGFPARLVHSFPGGKEPAGYKSHPALAAPRAEGLERRLLSAIFGSEEFHQNADVNIEVDPCAGCRWWTRFRAGTLYEGTGEPSTRPSDERVPEEK